MANPIQAVKGVRRRLLNKLKKTIDQVYAMDTRETKHATLKDVQPVLYFENARLVSAAQRLQDQVDDLLSRIK